MNAEGSKPSSREYDGWGSRTHTDPGLSRPELFPSMATSDYSKVDRITPHLIVSVDLFFAELKMAKVP